MDASIIPLIEKAISIAGSQTALGRATGISQAAIQKLYSGKTKKPSPETAIAIEKATNGQVTRHELLPNIFGPPPEHTNEAA